MFRTVFVATIILSTFVIWHSDIAFAQFEYLDGTNPDTASVTIGDITYDTADSVSSLQSAQTRLSNILYYLRTLDSPSTSASYNTQQQSTTSAPPNVYSEIINFAFEDTSVTNQFPQDTVTAAGTKNNECPVFTTDFNLGSQNAEIVEIQKFLNTFPETQIASSGVGSAGQETEYFGTLTFAAVFAFQSKYADEILTPVGLLNPTGYWGGATRAQANKLFGCTA